MYLYNNKISSIQYALTIYDFLITLDLSKNNITLLEADQFRSQINLQILNISRNNIEKLRKNSLNGLKALLKLDLSYNRIEELHNTTFLELHSLQSVILSGNRITHLERGLFKSTKHLKELVLDENQLLEIPGAALSDALGLQRLILSQNLICSIDEGSMPGLSDLRHFLADNNLISHIHHAALAGLSSLDRLDLSDNNLTVIPTQSLAKLSNLTRLKLSGNFIKDLPPVAFRGLFRLRYLYINRMDYLEKIDVRAFVDNINLERIWLNDNLNVKSIPTRLFHGNPHIGHISIRNNGLTTIEATHFPLDQLRILQLGGNPLTCNCSLLWLWHLTQEQTNQPDPTNHTSGGLQASSELYIDLRDIICASPEALVGKLLVDVTDSEINCSISWLALVSASILIIFLIFAAIAVIVWGPLKRSRAKEPPAPKVETFDQARMEKCLATAPVSDHDYRSLAPWEKHYRPDYGHCINGMNIYEQLDSNFRGRPHIVYV